jgi:hypothetical protein
MYESQIAKIINTAYDGVERSKVGKIVDDNAIGVERVHHVAFNTYLTILNNLIPKNLQSEMGFHDGQKDD